MRERFYLENFVPLWGYRGVDAVGRSGGGGGSLGGDTEDFEGGEHFGEAVEGGGETVGPLGVLER